MKNRAGSAVSGLTPARIALGILFVSICAAMFFWVRLPFVYFLVLIAPGIIAGSYLPKNRFNVADKMFLSPVLGSAGSVLFGSILSLVGLRITASLVKITYVGLLIPVGVIFILAAEQVIAKREVISANLSIKNFQVFISKNWHYCVLAFLVVLGIIAKVAPGLSALVPPLHDPATHATWSKSILDTGYITYFYSPGLHLLTVFSSILSGVEIPKHLIYITNFFNAYVGVGFFLFIIKVLRDRFWAVAAAAMFTFGYYPALFYTTAGKNSLVVAVAMLPVAMLFAWYAIAQKDKISVYEQSIIPSIMFSSLFLVHYPSIYIYLTFVAGVAVYALVGANDSSSRFNAQILVIKKVLSSHAIGAIVIIAWILHVYGYYIAESRFAVGIEGSASTFLTFPKTAVFSRIFANMWNEILVFDKSPGHVLLIIFIVGFLWLNISKKKARFTALWFAMFLAGILVIDIFQIGVASLIRETAILSFFVFTIIGSSALFALVVQIFKDRAGRVVKILAVLAVMILAIFMTAGIYIEYTDIQQTATVVTDADLAAMKWVQKNIPEKDIILNRAVMKNGFLFGTDAGYWIPVYTDRKVEFSFLAQKDKNAFGTYDTYTKLVENPGSKQLISDLESRGVRYIYFGSKRPDGNALKWEVLTSEGYEQVYNAAGVRIYRLNPEN